MANKDDFLTEYRAFFLEFANTVEPNDQLPVKLGSYKFINSEVVGGIVDWCLQYLNRKSCPSTLIGPLIKITIDEIRQACKKHPVACGFNPSENVYEPLKLMQTVMGKVNEICLRYLDNSQLDTLPCPATVNPPKVSICSTRNTRRRMEDKHIVIHDLHSMFNIPDTSPASYYAIFDGHAGSDAASYSAAHLHQYLVESPLYPSEPENALKEAFLRTDECFLEKSRIENFRSGTTAVCALLFPKQETLYVAWVGDSQALLVNRGKVLQIVKPHKPSREDEKDRIEANGGCVMFWGMWRVNGQLAVSRAIGDLKLKPYVTAEPDIVAVPLDGNEEFLIMACDGLWDFVSEDDAAIAVYKRIKEDPENIENIAETLSDLAKQEGSRDNISVIIIFLKDPIKIAKNLTTECSWLSQKPSDVAMETGVDNVNNTASNNFDLFDVFQKPSLDPFHDEPDFKSNGTEEKNDLFHFSTNGKPTFDDDLGPETDIDAVIEKDVNMDLAVQRAQSSEFEPIREQREETPTPPADSVLDSSGVTDNVAESEESEDEWNYYKVDQKETQETLPSDISNKVSSTVVNCSDEMSQLNPDAKEFIPVSPTRVSGTPSPFPRDLGDELIAQSPRRAVPMDISVPSPVEFQCEVKQRPSELFDDEFDNQKTEQQNGHQLSSQEIMQNLLNGKDVSEIEFHPQNITPSDFIENQKENLTPSEENPTNSSLSPAQDEQDFSFIPKPQDPMSMSFYQDKNEDVDFSTNPFDLNKVQVIPDNIDEFIQTNEKVNPLQSPSEEKEHISPVESPLGVPLSPDLPEIKEEEILQVSSPDQGIQISNSPQPEVLGGQLVEEEHLSPRPVSPPLEEGAEFGMHLKKNPFVSVTPEVESPQEKPPTRSPSPRKSPSPLPQSLPESKSPLPETKSPLPDAKSPLLIQTPVENSPIGPLSPKSPIPELTGLVSPDITASIKDDNISAEDGLKSPIQDLEDVQSPDIKSPEVLKVEENVNEIVAQSPEIIKETVAQSPEIVQEVIAQSPEIAKEILAQSPEIVQEVITLSPEIAKEVVASSPEIANEVVAQSPESAKEVEAQSPEITKEIVAQSPEVIQEVVAQSPEIVKEVCEEISAPVEEQTVQDLISDAIQDIVESGTQHMPEPINDNIVLENLNLGLQHPPEPAVPDLPDMVSVATEAPVSPVPPVQSPVQRPASPSKSPVQSPMSPVKSPVQSPMSPVEEIEKFQTEAPESWKQNLEIKTELIQPEFAVPTIASPCEDSKGLDTPPTTPAAEALPPLVEKPPQTQPEPEKPKTAKIATKKPSPASPTKPPTPSAKTTPIKRTTALTSTKAPATSKPSATSAASPKKPLTPRTSTTTRPAATPPRKPLTNGDVKPPAKTTNGDVKPPARTTTLVRKTAPTTTAAKPASTTTKPSPAKPLSRPTTATKPPVKTTSTTSTRPASATAARPKPSGLAPKPATAAAPKAAPRPSTAGTTKPATTTTLKPKPPTTTAAPKPRTPLTASAKPLKPDTEKQIKETANKQISATRTTTNRTATATRTTTSTVKKIDSKQSTLSSTRTTTTRITTKPLTKKSEVTKTTITKTKSVGSKPQENGVVVIQELTATAEPPLLKDNSPTMPVPDNQLVHI